MKILYIKIINRNESTQFLIRAHFVCTQVQKMYISRLLHDVPGSLVYAGGTCQPTGGRGSWEAGDVRSEGVGGGGVEG